MSNNINFNSWPDLQDQGSWYVPLAHAALQLSPNCVEDNDYDNDGDNDGDDGDNDGGGDDDDDNGGDGDDDCDDGDDDDANPLHLLDFLPPSIELPPYCRGLLVRQVQLMDIVMVIVMVMVMVVMVVMVVRVAMVTMVMVMLMMMLFTSNDISHVIDIDQVTLSRG